jgi:cellulose synthase/poly-beta-1,6-N-acetylglucosamine synthase-like glycosyltransferase
MMIPFYFITAYYSIFFIYLIVLISLLLFLKRDEDPRQLQSYPFISILIAARNEESSILSCLRAVADLSWPAGKMEVLIGNDLSTDGTEKIVLDFIKDNPAFRIIKIEKNLGTAKGKANVLATLAKQAKGDLLFITDADIQVPAQWIQSLLGSYNERTGIVSGATITRGTSLLHYCQTLDWIYAFGMIKVVSDHAIPVSAVGNNMMISKKAYLSTGGYESIPFSVTEDLQLFLETLKKGWKYKNRMSPDCLAVSKPIDSFSKLLSQRKRWMQGAIRLPLILLLFLFVQALFVPMIIVTLYLSPQIGIACWLFKIVLQQLFIYLSFKRIGENYSVWKGLPVFEIYSGLFSMMVLFYYLIPTKVQWKGRKY